MGLSTFTESGPGIEKVLAQIGVIGRTDAIKKAMRKAGGVVIGVAKPLVPVGGREHEAGRKHLRDTLTTKVVEEREQVIGVVGPKLPEGRHGHLVERGHRIVVNRGKDVGKDTGKRAKAQPFMEPASAASGERARQELIDELQRQIEKIANG